METVPITQEGLDKLKQELDRLIREERPNNVKAIEEARSHGDLSENAEYTAAKERQGFLEGRIMELQGQIGCSMVVDVKGPYSRCVFGATVTLESLETGEEKVYTLVGPFESAPERARISVVTPIGQALIGKEEGDEIRVKTPKGYQEFLIAKIE